MKTGILSRKIEVSHDDGKLTRIDFRRFISMNNPHLGGLEYKVTPVNYNGEIEIKTELDADLKNDGVSRYPDLDQNHIEVLEVGT